jgi:hypothetical protein
LRDFCGLVPLKPDLQTNIGAKEKEAKLKRVGLLAGRKTDMEVNFIYRVLVGERDLFYGGNSIKDCSEKYLD